MGVVVRMSEFFLDPPLKEALHIIWKAPNLTKQLNHCNMSLNF